MREIERGRRKTLFFKSDPAPFSPDEEISGACLSDQSKRANFIRRHHTPSMHSGGICLLLDWPL